MVFFLFIWLMSYLVSFKGIDFAPVLQPATRGGKCMKYTVHQNNLLFNIFEFS